MTDRFGPPSIDYRYNKAMGAAGTPQILTVTGTSTRSTVLYGNTCYEATFSSDMHVLWQGGASDNATTANMLYFGGERYVFTTPSGSAFYVSAIRSTSDGFMYLAETSNDRIQ